MQGKTAEISGELLGWLKTTAQKGGDFLAEEAPLYAQEVVSWTFWSNSIGVVLISLGIVASILIARHCWTRCAAGMKSDYDSPNPAWLVPGIVLSILPLVLIMPLVFCIMGATKAAVAPRMVIVEHVRGLAN